MKHFDVDDLVTTAKQRTGLANFGEPDFMDNLAIFMDAVNDEQAIAEDRWHHCREYFIRLLINRLWFAKDLQEHPEILDEELKPPVIILPLPRTGSTKLHKMLAASGSFQDVLWWHMHMLSRIPGKDDGGVAERIRATQEFERWSMDMSPDMAKGHPLSAMTTEEEQILHEMTFWSVRMSLQCSTSPSYHEWQAQHGAQQAYEFLFKQLQYIQWQHYPNSNKPFLLKSPSNIGQEENLVRIFGRDIKFIATHRDPVNVVCSISEVMNQYRKIFSTRPTEEIAEYYGFGMTAHLAQMAMDNMAWRDANPDVQVLDVGFNDINNNPAKVLKNIYEFLGMELTPDIQTNIDSWQSDKTRNNYQKNSYSLERFCLTKDVVHDAFKPYIERFSDYIELS